MFLKLPGNSFQGRIDRILECEDEGDDHEEEINGP